MQDQPKYSVSLHDKPITMEDRVTIEKDGHIAIVRLSRPDKMNALDIKMFDAIIEAGEKLNADDSVRAVVLTGEGKSFCAGLDISMFSMDGTSPMTEIPVSERTHGIANRWQKAVWVWRELQVPVVAAVHGIVYGGGLQIMLAADIKFAQADSKFSIMEMKWGIFPDMAGPTLMRNNIREDIYRELTYTNRVFSGAEAVEYGFATHVSEDPLKDAISLAKEIASKNPDAIVKAKKIFNAVANLTEEEILQMESREMDAVIGKPNQLESIFASMQKRAGDYKNYRDSE